MRTDAPRPTLLGTSPNPKLAALLGMAIVCATVQGAPASKPDNPPADFPHFVVPGHEPEMNALRNLFWHHYSTAGPVSTLWDEWLPAPTLWPAVQTEARMIEIRDRWRNALSARILDADGYVSTHQHASIAHPLGWPFPYWSQGVGTYGWHFSFKDTVGPPWRPTVLSDLSGWEVAGASNGGIGEDGWNLYLDSAKTTITSPQVVVDTYQAPFLQIRWRSKGLEGAHPYIEWATETESGFSPSRRMYFDGAAANQTTFTLIPMYKNPLWTGKATRFRIAFDNVPGASVILQALFTQYDTRQNVNNASFIDGCIKYFHWTGDIGFLKANIQRMRTAMNFLMTDQHGLEKKAIETTWVGHTGKSGIEYLDGKKTIVSGQGIGDNYWDLLPFGNLDAYATLRYYGALIALADLEDEIGGHPEWGIEAPPRNLDSQRLEAHAAEVKKEGNRLFWDPKTERFIACIDVQGGKHDYGYTFLNLEAIYYGFADDRHADQILKWIKGERIVGSDTSTGLDIYKWRFAPRATTRRNIDWYMWAWSAPESIPWGDQVQDGGAVLGWSYHDVMSRLKVDGPDDAWNRLREIAFWYAEVDAAGGYRKYYDGVREGHLQGGGTPGGLGLDDEFIESILVPETLIDGFLGFEPKGDGFEVSPRMPRDWPEFSIDQIHWHNLVLSVHVTKKSIEITRTGPADPVRVSIDGHKPVVWSGAGPLRAKL